MNNVLHVYLYAGQNQGGYYKQHGEYCGSDAHWKCTQFNEVTCVQKKHIMLLRMLVVMLQKIAFILDVNDAAQLG